MPWRKHSQRQANTNRRSRKKQTKTNNQGEAQLAVECAISGYKGPTKLIAVPQAISEDVLAAALKAAMAAATVQVGGVTVSAPPGFKAMASAAKTKAKDDEEEDEEAEDDEEHEEEGDGDDDEEEEEEEEGEEEDEGEEEEEDDEADEEVDDRKEQHRGHTKTVKKRPASVGLPLPEGWKQLIFHRGTGEKYYMFESPAGKRFRSIKEVGRAVDAD